MSTTAITVNNTHWSVTMDDGDEPTILDEELGRRLGFSRPRKIRQLIERLIAGNFLNHSAVRTTVVQTSERGGRPATAYRLTQAGAMVVIVRSDSKIAPVIVNELVEVFLAFQRRELARPEPPRQIPVMSTAPLIGDSRHHRGQVADWCKAASRATGANIQRVHGEVRRIFPASGIYHIQLVLFERVIELLESLIKGRLLLGPAKRAPAGADPRQGVLPFPVERIKK